MLFLKSKENTDRMFSHVCIMEHFMMSRAFVFLYASHPISVLPKNVCPPIPGDEAWLELLVIFQDFSE